MDAFHKVLVKIYELTGGRDSQDVDFMELLRAEGFFSSRESIREHLGNEGWITDSPRAGNIRITHWGTAEAKKVLSSPSKADVGIDRVTSRLGNVTRDFSIVVEEFIAKPSAKTLKPVEERLSELDGIVNKVKSMV
ncbi:MAG TPA: hypothetical protein VEV84_05575 [Pyrinomonadaceae bacterium]|jgi:hypothetical protein|nr:hypothetical protein [Pyrinomonadaceae bacterium]